MKGSTVLGPSRDWIYVFEFESGSCFCPRRNGRDTLAEGKVRLAMNARKEAMGADDFEDGEEWAETD